MSTTTITAPAAAITTETRSTLGKALTATFFVDEDGFQQLEERWKTAIKQGFTPTSEQIFAYAVLRGKDWRKCFTPITSEVKLANGFRPHQSAVQAMGSLSRVITEFPFKDLISPNLYPNLKAVLDADALRTKIWRENPNTLDGYGYTVPVKEAA